MSQQMFFSEKSLTKIVVWQEKNVKPFDIVALEFEPKKKHIKRQFYYSHHEVYFSRNLCMPWIENAHDAVKLYAAFNWTHMCGVYGFRYDLCCRSPQYIARHRRFMISREYNILMVLCTIETYSLGRLLIEAFTPLTLFPVIIWDGTRVNLKGCLGENRK